jgi:hypothetical protein
MKTVTKLLAFVALCIGLQAKALTIDTIEVSTVFGYTETYFPGDFNRFGLLGVPLNYRLSDGRTMQPGAGWIPYTNGTIESETVVGDSIEIVFNPINNWAKGTGVLFYHLGQVWDGGAGTLWTEGELVPVGKVVLRAKIGSATGVLKGLARVSSNNASTGWGAAGDFVPYAKPEGSVVPYVAVYKLQEGRTWQPGIFSTTFSYQMNGKVPFKSARGD